MNPKDVQNYITRYNKRLENFGYSPETLGWGGGKDRQNLRFQMIYEMGLQSGDSVLDIGCGFADLFGFLKERGWTGQYLGVDINDKLLKVAKEKNPEVKVRSLNILETTEHLKYDWVIGCGIFNAKLIGEDSLEYTKTMLRRMYQISNRGVFADFMSVYVDFQHDLAHHTSPLEILDFLKREINCKFILRMDYLPYEFCVYLKNEML